jgi:dihydropteroate synthase type 2
MKSGCNHGERAPQLIGILNLTPDSFSDGGRYTSLESAVAHAGALRAAGAHCVELGPASSRPDAAHASADEEQRRLAPVLEALAGRDIPLGVDSYLVETQRLALRAGVRWLNDIQGFPDPALYAELAATRAHLVVMHSVQQRGPATREAVEAESLPRRIESFFERRIAELEQGGVLREQLILDPGMGFFLGSDSEASLRVLRWLPVLRRRFELPVLISVSRKSFLAGKSGRPPLERGAATLGAELYAAEQGVDYVRTHDVDALAEALRIQRALRGS